MSTKAAWIIDSGIAEYSPELNVKNRLDCTTKNCPTDTKAKKDPVGHGTFIAGIIGAVNNDEGVVGVAPGAWLNSLRIVKGKRGITNPDWVLRALKYIRLAIKSDTDAATPTAGDVVNLSLGMNWNYTSAIQDLIETELRRLADLGFKVSVAAGNIDDLDGPGYVQAFSPARAGGYAATGAY